MTMNKEFAKRNVCTYCGEKIRDEEKIMIRKINRIKINVKGKEYTAYNSTKGLTIAEFHVKCFEEIA